MDLDFAWLHPDFSTAGVAIGLSLLAYLVFVEPVLGVRSYAYLRRHRDDRRSRALVRVYGLTLAVQLFWLVGVVLVLVLSPRLEPAALGLSLPSGPLLGPALACTAAAALGQVVAVVALRKRGTAMPAAGDFALLLPATPVERRLAGLVAVGAGVSEELAARGLLIALGVGVFGLSPLVAAMAATVLFGLLHLYQGWSGVLLTILLGAGLAALYLATASLLLPILFHIAIDLRGLLLTPRPGTAAPPEATS